MTLEGGGGGGIVGDIVGGIGDVFEGVGNAISDVGVAIDEGVNDVVPGGWGTLGTIAAAVAAPYLLPTLSPAMAAAAGAAAARGVEGGVKGKDWQDTLQSMAISGATAYAGTELFGPGVEGGEGGVNDLGAGSSGYGEANDLFVPSNVSPDPFVPDVPMPDVSPDFYPEFSPDIPVDSIPVAPDVAGYESLIDQLANAPMEIAPPPAINTDTIAAAANTGVTQEQQAAYEKLIEQLQNAPMDATTYVNPADGSSVLTDPAEGITQDYLNNIAPNSNVSYNPETGVKITDYSTPASAETEAMAKMGYMERASQLPGYAIDMVKQYPLESAAIGLGALSLMNGEQQPQAAPQGATEQDSKYTGGYGSAGKIHDPYSLRQRVNAQNVYGYSSPISRYAGGGEVKRFGLGGLSNAITRFTQPIEKAVIQPIGNAAPFLRDVAPYAGLIAAPFIASPAMAAGVGALSSGFGNRGSGFNMKRAMMGGIAAYGMSNIGAGIEAAGTAPAMGEAGAGFTTGSMDAALNTPNAASSGFFRNPDAMGAGIGNLAKGSTYDQAATQFATKAGLPSAAMAVMGGSGVMAVDEGIEQQKASDAAAATAKGENQEMLNRIAAGKKRAQDAVRANPYMYAMGGSIDDESGMDEARGLNQGNLQNGFMSGGMPFYADGGMIPSYDLALRGLSQPAFNEGAVGGMQRFAMGGAPRFLSGGGDGMSDSIPATIEGNQEARLADGEFVIPADVVSHLGNGSSKAGAKQLYSMMDRVRQARVGTKKQGREIKPKKFMPA
jgi:hypothetical protein